MFQAISSYPYYYQQRPSQPQVGYPEYKQYYQPTYPNYYAQQTPKPSPPPKVPPQIPQPVQAPCPVKELSTKIEKPQEKIDSKVLNNLAIALQLLIVSNLMNNPSKDSPVSETLLELVQKPLSSHVSGCTCESSTPNYQMPNAKFLTSSNFADDGIMKMAGVNQASKCPRSNFGLMSPYDALANSGHTESLPSYRHTDFVSPYAAMSSADSYKDLFSVDF